MKSVVIVFLGCALIMCSLYQVEANCNLDGQVIKVGEYLVSNCIKYTCNGPGQISGIGCALLQCKKQIGYQDTDLSKPYPECCARPICDTD